MLIRLLMTSELNASLTEQRLKGADTWASLLKKKMLVPPPSDIRTRTFHSIAFACFRMSTLLTCCLYIPFLRRVTLEEPEFQKTSKQLTSHTPSREDMTAGSNHGNQLSGGTK